MSEGAFEPFFVVVMGLCRGLADEGADVPFVGLVERDKQLCRGGAVGRWGHVLWSIVREGVGIHGQEHVSEGMGVLWGRSDEGAQ